MNFVQEYQSTQVEAGHVQLFWLGQAGFLLKTASGRAIAIDPYFSDHVMRTLNNIGFKRMTPPPCAAIAFHISQDSPLPFSTPDRSGAWV